MTAKELREALEGVPDDAEVYVEAIESAMADEAFYDTENNRFTIFV